MSYDQTQLRHQQWLAIAMLLCSQTDDEHFRHIAINGTAWRIILLLKLACYS